MFSLVKPAYTKPAVVPDCHLDFGACLAHSELAARLVPIHYSQGARLCFEGQAAAGIFSICRGQAKEYFTSARGKTAIIRIVNPGDVIGLEGIFGESTYSTTVEALERASAYFISRRDLLDSMRSDERFRLAVAKQLSDRCMCAYHEIRHFRPAVPARVAHFLLERQQESAENDEPVSINLTREEIAQRIGSTRETVSRIVSLFRRKKWVLINGTRWKIQNRNRLAALATQQSALAMPACQ